MGILPIWWWNFCLSLIYLQRYKCFRYTVLYMSDDWDFSSDRWSTLNFFIFFLEPRFPSPPPINFVYKIIMIFDFWNLNCPKLYEKKNGCGSPPPSFDKVHVTLLAVSCIFDSEAGIGISFFVEVYSIFTLMRECKHVPVYFSFLRLCKPDGKVTLPLCVKFFVDLVHLSPWSTGLCLPYYFPSI